MGCTDLVLEWAVSHPVLTRWLSEIARDEAMYGEGELPCTVVDLLDPSRGPFPAAYLRACGISSADADAVWRELGGDHRWMDEVDWPRVRRTLVDSHKQDCAELCGGLHWSADSRKDIR